MKPYGGFGTFQHFKGGIYIVLCEAKHSETGEQLTIYVCAASGEAFARPSHMFHDSVEREIKDGVFYKGPRFRPIPMIDTVEKRKKLKIISDE